MSLSANYNNKMLNGVKLSFMCGGLLPSLLWGTLYRCLLHSFEGKKAVSTARLLTVVFLDLSHSLHHHLFLEALGGLVLCGT